MGRLIGMTIRIPNGSDHGSRISLATGRSRRSQRILRGFFLSRNAGDVDGMVAPYETGAVLAFPSGETAVGTKAIQEVYEAFLGPPPDIDVGRAVGAVGQRRHRVDVFAPSWRAGPPRRDSASAAGRQLALGGRPAPDHRAPGDVARDPLPDHWPRDHLARITWPGSPGPDHLARITWPGSPWPGIAWPGSRGRDRVARVTWPGSRRPGIAWPGSPGPDRVAGIAWPGSRGRDHAGPHQ